MGCPSKVVIGDNLVFSVTTHTPSTGALTDADAVPAYRVYEDETDPPILTGNMAKLDDDDTTGFYTESIACTAVNGFEDGKTYTIYVSAAVGGVTGGCTFGFKAETRNAREGADGDTLEDISDQIDAVPTASEIQSEMEENGASILDTISDKLPTNYIMGSSDQTDKDDDIDAILTDTNELQTDNVPGLIAALNNLSAAEVNAEVVDCLGTDTLSELAQGVPASTPTIKTAIMLLYMALRNKVDVDADWKEVHSDDGTLICKKALSDDATTYSEAKMVSGA